MKYHLAKQGETLASIYQDYYGELQLGGDWDKGFNYFVTANEHILRTAFLRLSGGEIVLLPENSNFNFTTPAVDIDNVR